MSITAKEFETSDGTRYRCGMFGAVEGQRLMVQVVKIVGPSLARVLAGLDDETALGPAVDLFCHSVSPEFFAEVAASFAKNSGVYDAAKDNFLPLEKGRYNDHFAGEYLRLIEWLKGCFEVNYAGFFDGLMQRAMTAALAARAKMEATEKGSPSPSTSTTPSIE